MRRATLKEQLRSAELLLEQLLVEARNAQGLDKKRISREVEAAREKVLKARRALRWARNRQPRR